MDSELLLGGKNKNSKLIEPIKEGDKILIFTSLDLGEGLETYYVAYTQVEEIIENRNTLYKNLKSTKKLRLKGITYFTTPILEKDLTEQFDFKKKSNSPFNSEFKEITEEDYYKIYPKSSKTKFFPLYFYNIDMSLDEFVLQLIQSNYQILKASDKNQIEIKDFLKILKKSLSNFNFTLTDEELEEFYSKNIWKMEIEHYPSRDSKKFVKLYTKTGHKKNFSYINLE